MFKRFFTLFVILLFACAFSNASDAASNSVKASDLIKVEVIKDSAPLRDQPSSKAKIISQGYLDETGNDTETFFVEPQPISGEGGSWYRVLFSYSRQVKYELYYKNYPFDAYYRFDGLPYVYVNTKDVRKVLSSSRDKEFLLYFDQGRPPRYKVGDDLEKLKKLTNETGRYRSAKTKKPIKLYREPDQNSKTFMLPAGTFIIDLTILGIYEGVCGWTDEELGHYYDMQDHLWNAIINANSSKVIGWLNSDDHDFIINSTDDNKVFLPPPSDDDIYKNWKKVFIY